MKYFWPILTFSFMFAMACEENALFPVFFIMVFCYVLHKKIEGQKKEC